MEEATLYQYIWYKLPDNHFDVSLNQIDTRIIKQSHLTDSTQSTTMTNTPLNQSKARFSWLLCMKFAQNWPLIGPIAIAVE